MNETTNSNPFNKYIAERYFKELGIYDKALGTYFSDNQRLITTEDLVYSYLPSILNDKEVFGEGRIPSWVWIERLESLHYKIKEAKRVYKLFKKVKKQRELFYKDLHRSAKNYNTIGLDKCEKKEYYDLSTKNLYNHYIKTESDLVAELSEILEELMEALDDKLNETI